MVYCKEPENGRLFVELQGNKWKYEGSLEWFFWFLQKECIVGHVSQDGFSYNYAKVDISKNKLLGKGNILCLKCYSQV